MANQILRFPLVGAHFRPPAKILLANLPAGTELSLDPEPENPYDSGAVRVLISGAELAERIPPDHAKALEFDLAGCGAIWEGLLQEEWVHLGYIASPQNSKALGAEPGLKSNVEALEVLQGTSYWEAGLGFTGRGDPVVVLAITDEEEREAT